MNKSAGTRLPPKLFLGTVFILAMVSSACGFSSQNAPEITPDNERSRLVRSASDVVYSIDPIFMAFYEKYGGEDQFGAGLSSAFPSGILWYQYTEKILMVYNPDAPSIQRFGLAPLGLEMNIGEPALPSPDQPDRYFRNGHHIWEEVIPLYDAWGEFITGLPLTEVRFNAQLERYEQYFENMGFYRLEGDDPGEIRLIAYGTWKCQEVLGYLPSLEDMVPALHVIVPIKEYELAVAEAAFVEVALRLGLDITGYPLTETYQAADGKIEKIYSNVVLAVDVDPPSRPYLRPIMQSLAIVPETPQVRASGSAALPTDYFWPTDGEYGYYVRQEFFDFITLHGGTEVSGQPITHEHARSNAVTRQCFTNLCLEYHQRAPASLRIRPAALGSVYKDLKYHQPSEVAATPTPAFSTVSLKVWERSPLLQSGLSQVINVAVFDNDVPVAGVSTMVTIDLPDGRDETYSLFPTDENGLATLELEPIAATNGTLVSYRVCLADMDEAKFCVIESFVIWAIK